MYRLPQIMDPDDPKTKVRLSLNTSLDFLTAKPTSLLIRPKKYEDIGNYSLLLTLTDPGGLSTDTLFFLEITPKPSAFAFIIKED